MVVALEGLGALVFAIALAIAGIRGGDAGIAFGAAVLLVLFGVVVSAAGRALWQGRRWGRGVAVFTQLLILLLAYYMLSGSHRPELGLPVGVVALVTLGLLFSPLALKWAAYQSDSASSDKSGPDTR